MPHGPLSRRSEHLLRLRYLFSNIIKDTSLQTQKDFEKAGFSFSQRHFSDLNRNIQPLINETTGKIKFSHGQCHET